jgi:hypothetical protein
MGTVLAVCGGLANVPHCPAAAELVQATLQFTPPACGSFDTVAATITVVPAGMLPGGPGVNVTSTDDDGLIVMVVVIIWVVSANGVAWMTAVKLAVTVTGAV